MAVDVVSVGAVQSVSGTSDIIPTPAGSIGDMVVFLLVHDDFSDGNLAPITPPITLTEIIPNQSTQFAGDFRANCYWGIEDQAAARDFNFGTLGASEGIRGVCLRFSGHAATPILAGTPTRVGGPHFADLTATRAGQMFVECMFNRASMIARTPAAGWTERVDSQAAEASIYCATKPVTTEGLTVREATPGFASGTAGAGYGFGFVIDVDSPTAYTMSGVTKDKDGAVLVSCQVVLLKDAGTNDWQQIATQVSHGTTGAFSFTVYDNAAKYMVLAYKAGTPNVFDVSDYVLQPVV